SGRTPLFHWAFCCLRQQPRVPGGMEVKGKGMDLRVKLSTAFHSAALRSNPVERGKAQQHVCAILLSG
ncbi:hypothetical protein, partial [Streptomyces globisporus]|uniref:hypothetical protein n=1 Tax=Streptomyces globisporus TaxID=1908 RepID=UPI00197FF725